MFQNYFKIAFRNIRRHFVFSVINIAGLTLGITSCLLILLWVKDEVSFDSFHKNGARTFKIMANLTRNEIVTLGVTPNPLAEIIQQEIPEIESVVKMTSYNISEVFTANKIVNKEFNGRFVSPDFFNVFSFPLVSGNPKTALNEPTSIVITQSLATKYFKNENPVDKVINIVGRGDFKVTGVMQDMPFNSSLRLDFILPYQIYEKENEWLKNWGVYSISTFLLLKDGINESNAIAKINKTFKEKNSGTKDRFFLQPILEMHLYSNFKAGKQAGGRIEYVRLFVIVAILILLIACINFMNLSTARSTKRAREIGIRKVTGATRISLILQFMGEAVLLTTFSLFLSLLLAELLLPFFNNLTGKHIRIEYFTYNFLLILFSLTIVTGFVAGSYPAFFLSSLRPVKALKGTIQLGLNTVLLRKGLVVFQFSLSIFLIIGMIVIFKQIDYVKNKNLGFNKENLLSIPAEGDLYINRDIFKAEALKSTSIQALTFFGSDPLELNGTSSDLSWDEKPEGFVASVAPFSVGYDFLKTMNITLKEGRDFSPEYGTDSLSYIINESTVKLMGLQDPLGKEISFWNGKGKIIGITPDFHIESLHEPIKPLILMLNPVNTSTFIVRAERGKTTEALSVLQQLVKKYNPNYPFEYRFYDDSIEKLYQGEILIEKLSTYAAFLAICISCLGLFGLALFTVEQRKKEISIRKVIGANVVSIVSLLSQDFFRLIILANVIVWPLGWWAMHIWLENFAYKITLGWEVFFLAGFGTLSVALLTTGIQTLKAALENPVKNMRSE